MYLVIKNAMFNKPVKDKYTLFSNEGAAVAFAKELGWEDALNLGLNRKPGIYNAYQCGDVDVAIVFLEVRP